ncbi:hypothetical protein JCGZ_12991 [Jatropha curcas]|uniref:FBD domain-containing protein n=1 Tax=Jatropha curcas TaxID=180498 RepID=A0A067KL11_JATCU|nr:hypothetical protein JCGZ_12991 [Jatropha curcas]
MFTNSNFHFFAQVKFIPETIPVFSQVTSLTLTFIRHPKFSMLKMISILSAFPCLCTFELMTRCPEDVDEEKAKPVEYVPRHLTKVELGGFCSTPNQMEFAIYLLKNASALRWLVIEQEVKPYVPKRQSWDEGEREMVYERLQEFAKDGVLVVR